MESAVLSSSRRAATLQSWARIVFPEEALHFLAEQMSPSRSIEDLFVGVSKIVYIHCLQRFEKDGFFGADFSAFSTLSEWALMGVVLAIPAWLVLCPPHILHSRNLAVRAGAAILSTQAAACLLFYVLILPIGFLFIHNTPGINDGVFLVSSDLFLWVIPGITAIYCVVHYLRCAWESGKSHAL